jgi:single-strand DNA-binding protein
MNTIQVTVAGNLTHDPQLRSTATGTSVTTIRLAVTTRRPTGVGTFENGETNYITCTAFGATAEHVAGSLNSGHRVLVTGRLVERSFIATRGDYEGETVRRHELVIDEIGPALRFATAVVTKAARTNAADDSDDTSS